MTVRIAAWIAAGALALAAPAASQESPPAQEPQHQDREQARDEEHGAQAQEKPTLGVDTSARRDLEKGTYEPNKEYYDSVWFELASEPEHHFLEALAAFRQDSLQEAADHIRRASTFAKMEATRPSEEARGGVDPDVDPLMNVYRELRFLAEAVEKGEVEDVGRFAPHFARAHAELARHHLELASRLWKPGQEAGATQAAGRHLDGAVQHTQRGLTWARSEPRRGEEPLHEAGVIAEMLQGDVDQTPEEGGVRDAFAVVEDEILRLDQLAAGGAASATPPVASPGDS